MIAEQSNPNLFVVEIGTPLGKIKGQVAVDSDPMRLAELVPIVYGITDIMVKRTMDRLMEEGKKISCGPGCGVCCRQLVPVSPPEAFFLVEMMESMSKGEQSEMMHRFDNAAQIIKQHDIVDALMDPSLDDDHYLPVARKYFSLQVPCPFLENDSCGIHPNRPVACRDYNVTSPPSWCSDPVMHDIEKVSMPFPLSIFLARFTAELTGCKLHFFPLALVPEWVSENIAIKNRQWPGVDLFQRFMSLIGSGPSSAGEEKESPESIPEKQL